MTCELRLVQSCQSCQSCLVFCLCSVCLSVCPSLSATSIVSPSLNSKGVTLLSSKEEDETSLKMSDATQVRSLTMCAAYLSLGRLELHYAVKEISRRMRAPTQGVRNRLKRTWPSTEWHGKNFYSKQSSPEETRAQRGASSGRLGDSLLGHLKVSH